MFYVYSHLCKCVCIIVCLDKRPNEIWEENNNRGKTSLSWNARLDCMVFDISCLYGKFSCVVYGKHKDIDVGSVICYVLCVCVSYLVWRRKDQKTAFYSLSLLRASCEVVVPFVNMYVVMKVNSFLAFLRSWYLVRAPKWFLEIDLVQRGVVLRARVSLVLEVAF